MHPHGPTRPTPKGPWLGLSALLWALALAILIAGGLVGYRIWGDLRSSLSRMDRTLDDARERQRQLIESLARAQALLVRQQEHLQEVESGLHAREAALEAERIALADQRDRLRRMEPSGRDPARNAQIRELARQLDLAIAGLADAGGIGAAIATLDQFAGWTSRFGVADFPALAASLAEARAALTAAHSLEPDLLARRIESLKGQIARLPPGPPRAPTPLWAPGPAGAVPVTAQLDTALFALSRGDAPLFRLSIDTAATWLAALYGQAASEIAPIRSELDALRQLAVRPDLDGARASLARLRAVLGDLTDRTGRGE
jgi:uncharacterized protein HemX